MLKFPPTSGAASRVFSKVTGAEICPWSFSCPSRSPTACPVGWNFHVSLRQSRITGSSNVTAAPTRTGVSRSEEHTSELQSRGHLVCRLLLEKKTTRHAGGRDLPGLGQSAGLRCHRHLGRLCPGPDLRAQRGRPLHGRSRPGGGDPIRAPAAG